MVPTWQNLLSTSVLKWAIIWSLSSWRYTSLTDSMAALVAERDETTV